MSQRSTGEPVGDPSSCRTLPLKPNTEFIGRIHLESKSMPASLWPLEGGEWGPDGTGCSLVWGRGRGRGRGRCGQCTISLRWMDDRFPSADLDPEVVVLRPWRHGQCSMDEEEGFREKLLLNEDWPIFWERQVRSVPSRQRWEVHQHLGSEQGSHRPMLVPPVKT